MVLVRRAMAALFATRKGREAESPRPSASTPRRGATCRRNLAACAFSLLLGLFPTWPVFAFADHSSWDTLLKQHVRWVYEGHASTVDYAGFKRNQAALDAYLANLSAVQQAAFDTWPASQQLAFFINAYNAFTIQLVLSRYPGLKSIKDLGSLFQSPWKRPFIRLLGKTVSLDDIEHRLIRGSGRYRDPRVHFALNCASVGCPALRPEAYTGSELNAQLEDQARRFLGDRGRNRLVGTYLEVSPIFHWYRGDFEQGFRGATSLAQFLALYARELDLSPEQETALRAGRMPIRFGDYDWSLNDSVASKR